MKEELVDIVESITLCQERRRNTDITVIGRVHCMVNGEPDTFWFTPRYYNLFGKEQLRGMGHFVPRNSEDAIKMQMSTVGTSFTSPHLNYIKRLANYEYLLVNKADFQNHTISMLGDTIQYQYRDIHDFLDALRQNAADIADVKNQIAELDKLYKASDNKYERASITKSKNNLQETYRILTEQQEDLKNITIYIRRQGEMRYSLIVDPIQTRIKSENCFDGNSVIINGGPGTGKTTTMIHRLGYLTDTFAINEDEEKKTYKFKLNPQQRKNLLSSIENQRDWMFFSPSQLLKEYLAQAMVKEGLKNTSLKVWNWNDYCALVLQENYRLLGQSSSKAPFKVCYLTDTLFYQRSGIIKEFTEYYLAQLCAIRTLLPEIDENTPKYEWIAIAKQIQNRLEETDGYDIYRFILLFNSLEQTYGNSCKTILQDNKQMIYTLADEICILIDNDKQIKSELNILLDFESNEDDEDVDESADAADDTNNNLNKKIVNWLKQYCYNRGREDVQLSEEMVLMNELIEPLVKDKYEKEFRKINELAIFEQYAKYTTGVKSIMINGLPEKYKGFRRYLLRKQFDGCNLKVLKEMAHRSQGRELHQQEQSLLLGFINNLVKQVKSTKNEGIKHHFISAYDELSRPIIGVDEATDFCECDIYAMESLLSMEFNSFTLSGDLMQRMTDYGIKSWEELDDILPNKKVVEMKTSYRQSKKLLEVARRLHQDTQNSTPSYKAYMKSNKVPAPLVYVSKDEYSKIEWISKRISEVYRAYGEQLPSIAIFVNDRGYIPKFVETLKNTEFFVSKGIEVVDGSLATQPSEETHISVYPIDQVKGMEFDVVFFHNIDNSSTDYDMLKRYIYVGVSRAAFFLGITLIEKNDHLCKYFESGKDWFKI